MAEGEPSEPPVTIAGTSTTSGAAPTDLNSPYSTGATVTVFADTGTRAVTGNSFAGWCNH